MLSLDFSSRKRAKVLNTVLRKVLSKHNVQLFGEEAAEWEAVYSITAS